MRSWENLKEEVFGRLWRNPHLARAYYQYRLHHQTLQYSQPPLLLYQMGKVGSKTIRDSLQPLQLDMPIFHVHFLSEERVRQTERERRKYLGTQKEHLLEHIWEYQYLRRQIARGLGGKKWKIVTLTREPISRNISAFFENLQVEPLDADRRYKIQSDYYGFQIVCDIDDLSELTRVFFTKFFHDRPLVFFDQELKGVLGIDVFATKFPTLKGYAIYEEEHADVLLIKVENLSTCARDAFKEFMDIDGLTLVNTNVGSAKVYAPIYKEFKNSIVLPESYVDRMYTSKYMRHFYSEEEIARFREKWHTSGN